MRTKAPSLLLALLAAACYRAGPLPTPPPAVVEIDPPDLVVAEIADLSSLETGLEPAPFPEPPGELPPTSASEAPDGLNLSGTVIPLEINPRVQYWIDLFTGNERERFALYLARQGRFEDMIVSKLKAKGMPEELIYLALIESGFSPIARSRASAVGMWQFMAATARIEGLVVSEYLDERRHVERSTDAALNHLEGLYNRFGSWYLAAAAYNSGAGRISRALARTRNAPDGDGAFWSIHSLLPRETRDYVPKLVAATIIGRNRARFGFDTVELHTPLPVDRVIVPDATDLSVAAEAAGVAVEELVALNAHLPRHVTPPGRATEILLPPGTLATFEVAFAEIPPEKRVRFLEHTVRRGETLSHIARRYGTSVSAIQQANALRSANRLSIGQRLRIRRGNIRLASTSTRASGPAAVRDGPVTHVVRSGESVWSIARRYGVGMEQVLSWNALTRRSVIKPGDRLLIRPES